MKKILIILILILMSYNGFASPPDWYVPEGFQYSMPILCRVYINDVAENDAENLVGAFAGEEVRGVNTYDFFDIGDGVYVASVTVASNTLGEEITFKLYDASEDTILPIEETLAFQDDGYGSYDNPYEFHAIAYTPPTANFKGEPLMSENVPLEVTFTDLSLQGTESMISWKWDFDNDGTFDLEYDNESIPSPITFIYNTEERYSVKLVISDGITESEKIKDDYIWAGDLPQIPWDLNNDGKVDIEDVQEVMDHWGETAE